MEMLIFLNGMLFVCNVALLAKVCIRQKSKPDTAVSTLVTEGNDKLTPEEQWKNMLEYTGDATEGRNDD
jgi:hypothetical protein